MERRQFTRVPFVQRAIIEGGGQTATGVVSNLSLNGLFLESEDKLDESGTYTIKIMLSQDVMDIAINLKGTVVRCTEGGIAMMFEMDGIDVESFTLLRTVLSYNSGDPDLVMREFTSYLDKQRKKQE